MAMADQVMRQSNAEWQLARHITESYILTAGIRPSGQSIIDFLEIRFLRGL
jgi:hypothetical protein